MKLFFIADIHGNQFALKRILEHASDINSDMIFCTGDMGGYFTGINEVVELLKSYQVKSIIGNHDAFILGMLPINQDKAYYKSYVKSRDTISVSSLNWLTGLTGAATYSAGINQIQLYHGGPANHLNEYIYPDMLPALETNVFDGADVIAFGHTHLQFALKQHNKLFINPGSVGLPRNGDVRAHGMFYDTDTGEITDYRLAYDVGAMIDHYLNDQTIDPMFFHNVNFGRSSKRKLKTHPQLFLSAELASHIQSKNLNVINTKFGAVLWNDKASNGNMIYIASYEDDSIVLTTSTLNFGWQHNFSLQTNYQPASRLVKDMAGTYCSITYASEIDFNASILADIESVICLIENHPIKNVKI